MKGEQHDIPALLAFKKRVQVTLFCNSPTMATVFDSVRTGLIVDLQR